MINEIIAKVNLHKDRLKLSLEEIKNLKNLDSDIFENFEKIKMVDSFIYRFITLQDIMGEELFKTFLNEIGEYKDTMSLLDILDKLEKFEIVEDAYEWMEYRKLRNQLIHEYPNNKNDVIDGINIAIELFDKIEIIFNKILEYMKRRLNDI